ncbi:nicotinamide N-methyltransferase-like isoform X2 [Limulus polyphemus]|nr:nicotinamide N-methyltransferase-like isoform X2 [Limulus polyphemus]XP_013777374.1 nicotinamide N-methyltransferase-like isoform X2 [Limulus polyphemus]XP_022244871.1 nicotinamide N-methyltransferase-like isoform X2 [Limulus polyphemus]
MPMTNKEVKSLYRERFDPVQYHTTYYSNLDKEVEFFLTNIHSTLLKEKFNEGKRCLEIGSGPTVHSLISASHHFDTLVSSDYTEKNREEIRKWLNKDAQALDWTIFFRFVANMEKFSDLDEGVRILEERLRRKLKNVSFCDVFDSIPLNYKEAPFDVIITSLCLEFAACDWSSYVQALKNIAALLRVGGGIIMVGALNNTFYYVNDEIFPSLKLDQPMIQKAMTLAGFQGFEWKILERQVIEGKPTDHDGCFCVSAIKM